MLIHDAQTLRLHDLTADPRAVGFPPHHPLMRTFLGVPIVLRGVAYGNLYLTEKEGGEDFTAEDEELVTLLAAQAAVAIENARLYESATRWLAQLESLTEIGNALAGETELAPLLELIATRLGELIDAELVVIALPVARRRPPDRGGCGPQAEEHGGSPFTQRARRAAACSTAAAASASTRRSTTSRSTRRSRRRMGLRSGLFVPLIVGDRAIGVIAAHNRSGADPRFTDEELRLAETFAARAAVAVDLADRVARDALRRVVEGQELERTRLARELHDETGQALTSILLGLKRVEDAKTRRTRARQRSALRRAGRRHAPERPPARRRAAAAARSTTSGSDPRSNGLAETFAEQTGIAVDVEAQPRPGRLPGRDRDGALPHRAGGADQHRQARRRHARQRDRDEARGQRHGRRRGRRSRLRATDGDGTDSVCRDEGAGRPARG